MENATLVEVFIIMEEDTKNFRLTKSRMEFDRWIDDNDYLIVDDRIFYAPDEPTGWRFTTSYIRVK